MNEPLAVMAGPNRAGLGNVYRSNRACRADLSPVARSQAAL